MPSTTKRPSSPLQPDGFGAVPPTRAQLSELGDWLDGPGAGARAATDQSARALTAFNDAVDAQDIGQLKDACQGMAGPLTLRLPAALPTPDPDTTTVLQYLVDDGKALSMACTALTDPPTDEQLDAVQDGVHQLGTDLETTGTIMSRNGDLLRAESRR